MSYLMTPCVRRMVIEVHDCYYYYYYYYYYYHIRRFLDSIILEMFVIILMYVASVFGK